ncbi:MAG: putative N6-adenine-specific DNA methylase YpsC [Rhodobacteraceae bacterium HLUCCA12]|nr:MAG: putative N6-adenine-specific DNA methylase YpsC [Rhodobacteraceae bacterium HLUCCA12]
MHSEPPFEIFLAAPPGLETALADEAREKGFAAPASVPGGVTLRGDWSEVWRANLVLRGAGRVLVRIGAFRALHLAQLDKRARRFPWAEFLRPDVPVKVEAVCRASRIYHAGAAAQRIERALREELGVSIEPEAPVRLLVRIEDDLCSFSLDTSGEPLHRRGHKQAVNKAPLRETLAALFLRQCGFDGCEPVLDPMCGSGTLVIEAAEIALGLDPGRSRGFAFEHLVGFDASAWARLRAMGAGPTGDAEKRYRGFDRDQGAIAMSRANAERAGVAAVTEFRAAPISDLARPEGAPGLVMVNPPYGGRVGNRKLLFALYGTLGKVLSARFSGWRVGLITSEPGLARATGLPFLPVAAPVAHGGVRVTLYRTAPLP